MKKTLIAASAALLASTIGVYAQNESNNAGADAKGGAQLETEIKKMDEGAAGAQDGSAASDKSAKDVAPGQIKQGTAANEVAPGQKKEEGTAANEVAPGRTKNDTAAGAGTSDETTASINLTAEQQTEVRTVFREVQVEPVNIDIEVNIGTVAPETIVLHPLPARFIEIVPAYRSYRYFVLADGTIVIVVPETRKVVYVITA